jgi:hypothetical protein
MSTPTLFLMLLGDQADRLPPLVRRLHARDDRRVYRGEADVERGGSLLARLAGAAAALPPASADTHLDVTIEPWRDGERWTRNFGGAGMQSRMWASGGLLRERLGLVTFGFKLGSEDDALVWRVARVSCLGVPLPAALFRGVIAREFQRDGRYCFDVRAELPLAGLLVHYRGWLDVE